MDDTTSTEVPRISRGKDTLKKTKKRLSIINRQIARKLTKFLDVSQNERVNDHSETISSLIQTTLHIILIKNLEFGIKKPLHDLSTRINGLLIAMI